MGRKRTFQNVVTPGLTRGLPAFPRQIHANEGKGGPRVEPGVTLLVAFWSGRRLYRMRAMGTVPKKSEFLISINSESNQAPIVAVPRVLANAAREMAMTNNEAYYLRRAEQEEQAAIKADNPQAMTVHRDLAGRYRTRASEPEDGRHLKLVRD